MNTTVSTIYFSPTGNTKKTVEAMASAIRPEFQTFDITVCPPEQETAFTGRDFVIFGVPVYAGRVPTPAAERPGAMSYPICCPVQNPLLSQTPKVVCGGR